MTVGPPFYERTTGPQFAALLLLMGIVPLVAWRITTVNRIGHLIWKPTMISLLVPITSMISGTLNFAALLSLWLASLVFCVTIYEFYRGAIARSKSSGNSFIISLWLLISRNRRRYGGYIVHLGIVFMAVGIIGVEMFQTETQGTLALEEQMSLEDYSLVYKDLTEYPENDGRFVTKAILDVYKNNKLIGELEPRRDYYNISQQRMTIPDVYSTVEGDLYVLLIDWKPVGPQQATFKVYLNPLINWIWIGGFLFILGTLVATWPDQRDRHIITNNKSIVQPF